MENEIINSNVENLNQTPETNQNTKKKKPVKLERSNRTFAIISSSVLGVVVLFYVFILGWAFITSFKSRTDFQYNPLGLPSAKSYGGWHFENFVIAFKIMYISIPDPRGTIYVYAPEMLMNSVIYSLGSVFMSLFMTALVAYCCAKYNYKICKIIYAVVIVVMILPIVGALPSSVQMSRTLGLYDSLIGIIFQNMGFCNINFLIFYGAFKGVSKTYSEAAFIDGAGQWSVYFRIILPLIKSSLLGVGLLQFITFWNDFSNPMIFLPTHPVLAYGLQDFQNSRHQSATDPVKLAATFITCIPVIIMFICFRKKLMSNITFGGLKG
ncbi:MAG: carbohydrate ABC transporter permease [Clostridia bacterium]|nr:carbohydrate ABC transporter permease [Clostridia bacterium]